MKQLSIRALIATWLLGTVALHGGEAHAAALIYNTGNAATATVALGVNAGGHLNTAPNIASNAEATGLAFRFADGTWQDATAPGCLCEGWGLSAGLASGFASIANGGIGGLNFDPITGVTSSTVTTSASLSSLSGLSITHHYAPSLNAPDALFRVAVTITNATARQVDDVRYARVMDWDVPTSEFNELVTIRGTASTALLEHSNNNGFCSPDPLEPCDALSAGTTNVDFSDRGPGDYGAYFRFNFGSLSAGASRTFNIFYGAAASEASALAAIEADQLELYSLAQPSGGGVTGSPATFIFGFSNVGGRVLEPVDPVDPPAAVPEPGSLVLVGLGLGGLWALRRRRPTSD